MYGEMARVGVGVGVLQPFCRCRVALRGGVVEKSELRRALAYCSMVDLVHQSGEGIDAGGGFTAADHVGAVHS